MTSLTGPNWGTDKRLWPGLIARIQNWGSFLSNYPPPSLTLEFLGFRLNIPWTPVYVRPDWKVPYWSPRYLCIRWHLFRYDAYAREYIFISAMAKRVPIFEVMP